MKTDNIEKKSSESNKGYLPILAIIVTIFFVVGFVTALNDILVPHLKQLYKLNYVKALLVQFSFFAGYGLMSIPASYFISRFGYKSGLLVGLVTAAVGCLGFIPAAHLDIYGVFLSSLFILATGIVFMQVAGVPYVSYLGNEKTTSFRLNFSLGMNFLGSTVAPLFGAFFIFSSSAVAFADRHQIIHAIQTPYLLLFLLALFLAIVVFFKKLPSFINKDKLSKKGVWAVLLSKPILLLGALSVFLCVGSEVAVGSLLVNYLGLKQIAAMPAKTAAGFVSLYWALAMIGRFLGGFIMRVVRPAKMITLHASIIIALLLTALSVGGKAAMWCTVFIGLFTSIMYPTSMALSLKGLGEHTSYASGLLGTAVVGGAVVPLIQGYFADHFGLQHSFVVLIFTYLYVVFFGVFVLLCRRK